MYGSTSRSKCGRHVLNFLTTLLLNPRCFVSLAVVLTTTVTLLMFWTRYNNPVTIAEPNYGVLIDAGSSSSKVHLFQWPPHDGDPAKLLTIKPVVDELGDPRIKKVEPGIATFVKSPETAFTSIQPLLEYALMHIPPDRHQHTSLYILGTAGMRLLLKPEQDRIIEVIYQRTASEYPFYLPADGVQVISGKLEGVFSWIALNYLLGRLTPEYQHRSEKSGKGKSPDDNSSGSNELQTINTVGCLDMGGASLQLAFEVPPEVEVPPEYTVDINLGCGVGGAHGNQHKHKIIVLTYLGYGTNEARARYYQLLLRTHLENSNQTHLDSAIHLHSIRDPCAPLDSVENITINNHSLKIRGLGDFNGCKKALLPLMQQNSSVYRGGVSTADSQSHTPCTQFDSNCNLVHSFHRAPFSLKYESLDFYGTSEFWYTMRDVLRIGGHYTAYSYEKASMDYCQTNWRVLQNRFMKRLYFYADFYRLKSQCMKSAWISLILHEGLGFPKDSISLHSVASIDGQSVQWALGALIYNTRYLPLREVQQHQLQAPPLSQWESTHLSSLFHSSFLLPFLVVLSIAFLLLCCRHRKRPYLTTHIPVGPASRLNRSQSLTSLMKVHRRMNSLTGSSIRITDLAASEAGHGEREGVAAPVGLGLSRETRNWSNNRLKFVI